MQKPFVVTIVGSESSGKTSLCLRLAAHFACPWVPEYAREYLNALEKPYDMPDLEVIANRQHEIIKHEIGLHPASILIVDGGIMNLRLWAKLKYHMKIPAIENVLNEDQTHLYLLCRPKRKWSPDPLREAPELIDRAWIYNHYLDELVRHPVPLEIIHGSIEKKLEQAIKLIEVVKQQG